MNLHVGAIGFVSPLMLLGAAALALPIVAHLLNRHARRRITFPSIRLLIEARADQSGLFRLRRLAVLILRCVAMLMVVVAFARPLWLSGGALFSGSHQTRATILVLDVSVSMRQRVDGMALIDLMRAEGQRLISSLEPGVDLANIIYAGARPTGAYGEPIVNLTALGSELNEMEASFERADIEGALELAAMQLDEKKIPLANQQIVVMSDMQRDNWPQAQLAIQKIRKAGVKVSILPIGASDAPPTNLANIGLLDAKSDPVHPIAHAPAQLMVTLANHSMTASQTNLRVWVGDEVVDTQSIALGAKEQRQFSLEYTFDEAQSYRIKFEIDDDDLTADNSAYAVVQTVDRVNIALISDGNGQQQSTTGYFIDRALAPHTDDQNSLRVVHLEPSEVNAHSLATIQMIILANAPILNDETASVIIEHVREGAGLLIFCDTTTAVQNAATLERVAQSSFIPLLPRGVRHHTGDEPLHFGQGAWSSPPMQAFDLASQQGFAKINFYRTHAVDIAENTAAVLLQFTDGMPALASQDVANGRVIVANFSPDPVANDLPQHGLFVALLHAMVDHMRLEADDIEGRFVGASIDFSMPDLPSALSFIGPNDRVVAVEEMTGEARLPGFYTLKSNDRIIETFAINIDPRESNLTRITLGSLSRESNSVAEGVITSALSVGRHRPLWPYFVLGALLLYACELLILCVWRR